MDYLRKVSKSKVTRILDLSCVGLWSFPAELARLRYLTVLSLTGNSIGELSPLVAQLTALVELSLADNNLKQASPSLGASVVSSHSLSRSLLARLFSQISC
jgi:Leucine-rich repeat (LRR) protein